MAGRPAAHWMPWRPSRVATWRAASSCPPPATRRHAACCFSRPSHWTPNSRAACHRARRTTRFWVWCTPCATSTHCAKSFWCPRTSTCGSRPVRWAWRRRTTRTTKRWTMGNCCMPAHSRCRRTSGRVRARPSRAGRVAATLSTVSVARRWGSSTSISSSISKPRANPPCTPASPRSATRPRCSRRSRISRT